MELIIAFITSTFQFGNLLVFILIYCLSIGIWIYFGQISKKQKIQKLLIHLIVFIGLILGLYYLVISTKDGFWSIAYLSYGMTLLGLWLFTSWLVMLFDIFKDKNSLEKNKVL